MKNVLKKLIVVLMVMVFVSPGLPVAANRDLRELRRLYEEAMEEVREREGELAATRAEIDQIAQELKELDDRLINATDDLVNIEQALEYTIMSLEQSSRDLALAQEDLEEQYEAIRAKLRAMQEQGSTGLLGVLFQATSLRDFLLRIEYVNSLAQRDREMITRLEETEAQVSQMQEAYTRQVGTVDVLRLQQQEYVWYLEGLEAEREEYFEALRYDEERQAALLAFELEQAAQMEAEWRQEYAAHRQRVAAAVRQREQLNRDQQMRTIANLNGVMRWPVPSSFRITSGYGNRTHPTRRTREFHEGIDIGARSGSDIIAADSGTVILSGWHGGYGLTVIIDHGGGIHTLYAHNSRNLVSVGDTVAAGQVIARIGSTGVSTGPHLHFEVRDSGRHVNPGPFLGL